MQTVKDAANFVSDKVSEAGNTASKEANKEVAKDDNASLGTRASAAKDAIGDKLDAKKDETSAEVHKQKAQN